MKPTTCAHGVSRRKRCLECRLDGHKLDAPTLRHVLKLALEMNDGHPWPISREIARLIEHGRSLEPRAKELLTNINSK